MKFLGHRIGDKRIQRMVKRFLKAGVYEDGTTTVSDEGTPQGGIISPLLANIYLHYALDLWFEKVIRTKCAGFARMIRYADDCVPRTHRRKNFPTVRCCTKDEGRPLGAGLQEQAPNHLKLHG